MCRLYFLTSLHQPALRTSHPLGATVTKLGEAALCTLLWGLAGGNFSFSSSGEANKTVILLFKIFFKDFIYLLLERGEEKEKETESNDVQEIH